MRAVAAGLIFVGFCILDYSTKNSSNFDKEVSSLMLLCTLIVTLGLLIAGM